MPLLNLVDLIFIGLLIGSLALGFFLGVVRQALTLLGVYLATALAARYYFPLTRWLWPTQAQDPFRQTLIFFFLHLFFLGLFIALAWNAYRKAWLPSRMAFFNGLGGTLLAFPMALLLVGLTANFFLFYIQSPGLQVFPIVRILARHARASLILPILRQSLEAVLAPILVTLPIPRPPLFDWFIRGGM